MNVNQFSYNKIAYGNAIYLFRWCHHVLPMLGLPFYPWNIEVPAISTVSMVLGNILENISEKLARSYCPNLTRK